MAKSKKTGKRKKSKPNLEVVSDVVQMFAGIVFTSDEFADEVSSYCKIIRATTPHITQIGKELARLGYIAKRVRLDGKRVRVYSFKLKLAIVAKKS